MLLQTFGDVAHTIALVACRELVEEGVPSVQEFRGKHLMGALCGETVTGNVCSQQEMHEICKKNDFEIWLPNGNNQDAGDGALYHPARHTRRAMREG